MRVGVLGAAKIAERSMLPAMGTVDRVKVVALASRNSARGVELAERFGARFEEDYQAVVDAADVDTVYIPLPTALHTEWALRAIEAGKHVLVEKSLAGSFSEVARVVAAAEARGVVLFENFMCERHPQSVWVRDAIASGSIGEVHSLQLAFGFPPFPRDDQRNSRSLDGGALNDAGAYCLDMAAFYLGAQAPFAITARSSSADYDVDVRGAALIEFDGGATAMADFGFVYDYRNEARVWGSSGQIDVDRAFSIPTDRAPHIRVTRNTVSERVALEPADQFALQIAKMQGAIDAGDLSEGERRLRHAALMEAARISARESRRVLVSEVFA